MILLKIKQCYYNHYTSITYDVPSYKAGLLPYGLKLNEQVIGLSKNIEFYTIIDLMLCILLCYDMSQYVYPYVIIIITLDMNLHRSN